MSRERRLATKSVDPDNFIESTSEVTEAAAIADLVDSTAGTVDGTIADVSTVVTGVDGTGSNAASKADVDTRLSAIDVNFANLTADIEDIKAALRASSVIAR